MAVKRISNTFRTVEELNIPFLTDKERRNLVPLDINVKALIIIEMISNFDILEIDPVTANHLVDVLGNRRKMIFLFKEVGT